MSTVHSTTVSHDRTMTQVDVGAAVPSTRFDPGTLVSALWGLALLATLAACATGPSVGQDPSPTTVAPPVTVAAPRAAATPATVTTPTTVANATTTARSSATVDGFAIIDGARMHIRCVGSGATTVVLIGGFNDGGDNWGAIEAPLAQDARVCSSARLGTGTSDPPTAVQTFTSQATQLLAALESVGEPGPYVLAGHSFGGAEAVVFASMFPERVRGLLLIDASPSTWPETACAVPDDGSDVARSFRDSCTTSFHPEGNPENLDVRAAFTEVATITSLGQLPMVVLAADTKAYDGLDAGEAARLNDEWNEGQQRWAALSSVGQVVTVANTSHHIHLDQPAIVVEQIQHLSR